MTLALDTETTGLDPWHGCRPFYVSTVDDEGVIRCWEWDVNPLTREPIIPKKDLREIQKLLDSEKEEIVLHNAKFDFRMLDCIGIKLPSWDIVHDTAIASHALASQAFHKLKDLAREYCGIDNDDEQELREAVNQARRIGRKLKWRIAKPNDPHWPAMKNTPKGKQGSDSWWACDMWLPRAVAKYKWEVEKDHTYVTSFGFPEEDSTFESGHPWWDVCGKYGTRDAERTLLLWRVFKEALESEGLWDQYDTRRQQLGITYAIESRGVTCRQDGLEQATKEYRELSETSRRICIGLADDQIDNLNSYKQLQGVLFCKWNVPVEKKTQTGYSTKKEDLEATLPLLNERSPEYHFIKHLLRHRKLDKAVDYLDGYLAGGLSLPGGWLRLHPNFNITGTDTTRFSSNNPNAQNISKQEGFNLRRIFGPLPGREWFAIDYENIEMRIPAFYAREKALMKLFEEGGSYHLLVASILRPEQFKKLGPDKFKKTDEYRWIKNGNFAKQYGGQKKKVDATFKIPGAFEKLDNAMPKIAALAEFQVQHAKEHGYVITLGGYRLECPQSDWGGVKPTTPFNYWTQGSAGWAMLKAMIRVDAYLKKLNAEIDKELSRKKPNKTKTINHRVAPWEEADTDQALVSDSYGHSQDPHYYMVMTIHDELDFDFPIHPRNKKVIEDIKKLMEKSSDDLGVPLIASIKWIPNNWAEEKDLKEWKVAA